MLKIENYENILELLNNVNEYMQEKNDKIKSWSAYLNSKCEEHQIGIKDVPDSGHKHTMFEWIDGLKSNDDLYIEHRNNINSLIDKQIEAYNETKKQEQETKQIESCSIQINELISKMKNLDPKATKSFSKFVELIINGHDYNENFSKIDLAMNTNIFG